MKLTLALAQINTKLGHPAANLEKHLACAREARKSGADLFLMTSASPARGITAEQLGSAKWVEAVNQVYAGLFTNA